MGPDDLTPAQRDEVQMAFLRQWLGRKKRAKWEITHGRKAPVKRFDGKGRRLRVERA